MRIEEQPLTTPDGKTTYHGCLFWLVCDCGKAALMNKDFKIVSLPDYLKRRVEHAERYAVSYGRSCPGKSRWLQEAADFRVMLEAQEKGELLLSKPV